MITQEEQWALQVITNSLDQIFAEYKRLVASRGAIINLLEAKYQATFDDKTGEFKAKKEQ